jgi:hypothetical protein
VKARSLVSAGVPTRRVLEAGAIVGAFIGLGAVLSPFSVALTAISVLLVLPVLLRIGAGRSIEPLELLWPFLVCYAITFALKPILDRSGFTTYAWYRFDEGLAAAAVTTATASLLLIYCGYCSGAYRAALPFLPGAARDPSAARVRTAAVALACVGMLAVASIMRLTGATLNVEDILSGSYRTRVLAASYGRGYITVLCTLASFAPALQLFVALRTKRTGDWIIFIAVTSAVLAIVTVLYSRQLLLQTIVMLLVILSFKTSWLGLKSLVAAGIGILILGGFLGLRLRQDTSTPLQAFAFLGHTFDSFEFLSVALDRLPPEGHLGGVSVAEDVVYTYLPRRLFPDKPNVFGIVRVQNLIAPNLSAFSTARATFPPGFLVEGYANFGVIGLLLMGLMYGVGLRLAFEWFWPRRDRVFPLVVYGGLVLNMTGLFRSATQYLLQLIVYSTVLYILLYARLPLAVRRPSGELRDHAAAT